MLRTHSSVSVLYMFGPPPQERLRLQLTAMHEQAVATSKARIEQLEEILKERGVHETGTPAATNTKAEEQ